MFFASLSRKAITVPLMEYAVRFPMGLLWIAFISAPFIIPKSSILRSVILLPILILKILYGLLIFDSLSGIKTVLSTFSTSNIVLVFNMLC